MTGERERGSVVCGEGKGGGGAGQGIVGLKDTRAKTLQVQIPLTQ